jgi:hypothetical protein
MKLVVNVTHPLGLDRISKVSLRFTPRIRDLDWISLRDDAEGGDMVSGDGIYTVDLEPTQEMIRSTYHGLLVVEEIDGQWNLATIPLGPIASVGFRLGELGDDLRRAVSMGFDYQSDQTFPGFNMSFGSIQDADVISQIGESLMVLAEELQEEDVEMLIELASAVLDRARGMGVDTARHELFLKRAMEEFDLGNLVSAKEFTRYPLTLGELDDIRPVHVLLILFLTSVYAQSLRITQTSSIVFKETSSDPKVKDV